MDSLGCVEMVAEAVAEVYCKVVKGAFASCVLFEMLIDYCPFLVVVFEDGFKVGEGAHSSCGFVEESVLFVDDCKFSLGADTFSLFEFLGIDSALVRGLWVCI